VEVVSTTVGRLVERTGDRTDQDVQLARHATFGMTGDLAQHRIDPDVELPERHVVALARLQVGRDHAEHLQVVHLGVDVGDAQRHVTRRRHDVLRQELERAELDLDDRRRRPSAIGSSGRLAAAHASEREEAEHERAEGEGDRGPTQERSVIGRTRWCALAQRLGGGDR
jgi:hypothetical protein